MHCCSDCDQYDETQSDTSVLAGWSAAIGLLGAALLAGPADAASGWVLKWVFHALVPAVAALIGVTAALDSRQRTAFVELWKRDAGLTLAVLVQTTLTIGGGLLITSVLVHPIFKP